MFTPDYLHFSNINLGLQYVNKYTLLTMYTFLVRLTNKSAELEFFVFN